MEASPSRHGTAFRRATRGLKAADCSARRQSAWAVLALFLGLGACPGQTAADPAPSKESQIKAAFVLNFAKFVEWPATRFAATNAPVVIGVLGRSVFTQALEEVISGRTINGRPLTVQVVDSVDAAQKVHVLVCTAADDPKLSEFLPALVRHGVLTVGESEPFARHEGMIQLLTEGDKVRFAVNVGAAESSGLRVSAQLLKLAKSVRRKA